LIHLYAYTGSNELTQRIEVIFFFIKMAKACLQFNLHFLFNQVDAHVGGVNDLAFAHPNKQLCVVTCGDDKLIKVHKIYSLQFFDFAKIITFF